MNVMGTVFMDPLDNPIRTVEKTLCEQSGNYDISILDVHAEATSEKRAIGFYFDGKINVVVGTHTHVQTSDEQILPGGTAYITDLGMCGPENSVLGVKPECIIEKLLTNMPVRFELSEEKTVAHGLLVSFDEKMKPETVERITF